MKTVILLLLGVLGLAPVSAETFNVFYFESVEPYFSGPGGSHDVPPGLPLVSNLSVSPGDSMHLTGESFVTFWLDSYQQGDYFSFDLEAQEDERLIFEGAWFGIEGVGPGPTNFSVELWSAGQLVTNKPLGSSGIYDFGVHWGSLDHTAEIRFVGLGGSGDIVGGGPFESFGASSIIAGFTVIPRRVGSVLTIR